MNSSSSHCLVLVPNKADLPRDQWQVHTEQAFKFSEERNMYLYGEISALKDDDVTVMQLFEWIAFIQAEKYCSWQAVRRDTIIQKQHRINVYNPGLNL